tara:strand:+ start:263 stop:364 length:102 start_codon:yes stop_codon:yes gene_type:complete
MKYKTQKDEMGIKKTKGTGLRGWTFGMEGVVGE